MLCFFGGLHLNLWIIKEEEKPSRFFRPIESLIRLVLDEAAKEQSTCEYFITFFERELGSLMKKKLEEFFSNMLGPI